MPKLSNFLIKKMTAIITESCMQHYNFLVFLKSNNIDINKYLDLDSFEEYMQQVNNFLKGDLM